MSFQCEGVEGPFFIAGRMFEQCPGCSDCSTDIQVGHPDGTIWRAAFTTDGRIARACIEVLMGEYLCSVDGKPFGRAGDLFTVMFAALEHGVPLEAWSKETEKS